MNDKKERASCDPGVTTCRCRAALRAPVQTRLPRRVFAARAGLSFASRLCWLCTLLTVGACSERVEILGKHVEAESPMPPGSVEDGTSPSETGPATSGEGPSDPGTGTGTGTGESSTTTPTQTPSPDSGSTTDTTEPSSSSEPSSSTPEESTSDEACEQELCVELNASRPIGRRLWYKGHSRFSVKAPDRPARLAGIRLVSGYGSGTTKVNLITDNSPNSAVVLTSAEWTISRPNSQGWDGADFEEPIWFGPGEQVWIEVEPVADSRASSSAGGQKIDLHYRRSGRKKWSKMRQPVMVRLYCCID